MKPTSVKETTDIKEHEVVKGPAGTIKEIDREIEHTVVGPGAGTSAPTAITVSAVDETVETAPAAPAPASTTRVNPRTGKPLSVPPPLSLTPRDMSPIPTPADGPGPQLIREEHEEVSHLDLGTCLPRGADDPDCSASRRRSTCRHQEYYKNLHSSRGRQGFICRSIRHTTSAVFCW